MQIIYFFDRLPSVHRKTSNGDTIVERGSLPFSLQISNEFEERRNDDPQLLYTKEAATAGLTICDVDQNPILKARLDHEIDHVSADGKMVTIALSCLIKKFTPSHCIVISNTLCMNFDGLGVVH